jgi:hypothetical protein
MTKIKTIILQDYVIEIHYNSILKNKPYLIRIFNWDNEPSELRAEYKDIEYLYSLVKEIK